jgi:hypothetical protein
MAMTVRREGCRLDASLLAVVALLIRLPAFFSNRELVGDEGVFSSATPAMRDGALPFREVLVVGQFESRSDLGCPLGHPGRGA